MAYSFGGSGTSKKAPKRVKVGRPKCPLQQAWRCNPAPHNHKVGEGGRERRGLSAHSPSPRAQHPNLRSRNHERLRIHAKPRRPPECNGEKWMTPFHTPQAESGGLWEGSRRSANGWIASEIHYFWARKSQQRRAMWPLREGREIWGVDGASPQLNSVFLHNV